MNKGLVGFAVMFAVGCGGGEPAPQPTTTEAVPPAAPAAPSAPAGPAAPRIERDGYALSLGSEGPGYAVGQLGQLRVTLNAVSGWHVNQDFPTSVEVSAPASLGVQKARLAKTDAAAFDESHFVFDVPVTPASAGDGELRAKVSFAICKETQCLPQEETVALHVAVR